MALVGGNIQRVKIYRAFHNVLRDYKHLEQENQRTYLNGSVYSHRKTEKDFFFFFFLFKI